MTPPRRQPLVRGSPPKTDASFPSAGDEVLSTRAESQCRHFLGGLDRRHPCVPSDVTQYHAPILLADCQGTVIGAEGEGEAFTFRPGNTAGASPAGRRPQKD